MKLEPASPGPAETAALVALLRSRRRTPPALADLIEEVGSARAVLDEEEGVVAPQLLGAAAADIARWKEQGIRILTLFDRDYPHNLRAVYDRPPLVFVMGRLDARDLRSVAVIGSRQASASGVARARAITEHLIEAGYVVVSGLAAGVDTAAHTAALERDGRTIAVIGTGVSRTYPPQNASLQRRIAERGAVVSQFLPETGPRRENFPSRNAVMSGLTLATVIVEATHTSGTRTQARAALAQGRPVLVAGALVDQPWARSLVTCPGVHVIRSPTELVDLLARFYSTDALVA